MIITLASAVIGTVIFLLINSMMSITYFGCGAIVSMWFGCFLAGYIILALLGSVLLGLIKWIIIGGAVVGLIGVISGAKK